MLLLLSSISIDAQEFNSDGEEITLVIDDKYVATCIELETKESRKGN